MNIYREFEKISFTYNDKAALIAVGGGKMTGLTYAQTRD